MIERGGISMRTRRDCEIKQLIYPTVAHTMLGRESFGENFEQLWSWLLLIFVQVCVTSIWRSIQWL